MVITGGKMDSEFVRHDESIRMTAYKSRSKTLIIISP